MKLRSLLFVPGDRRDRMQKALGSAADALILDLEDAVAPDKRGEARSAIAEVLGASPRPLPLFVRINPLDGPFGEQDLAVAVAGKADGIVLPKSEGGRSVAELDRRLHSSDIAILPIAAETPRSIFEFAGYVGSSPRLCGLTWGAEDLAAAVGASASREPDGSFTASFQLARSTVLFAASAAGVPAIETVYPAFRDIEGLVTFATRARRDGFTGMLAIHPSQIEPINAAFTPTPDEIAWAERVVAAFEASPHLGVLTVDGQMIDAPHLRRARRLLNF